MFSELNSTSNCSLFSPRSQFGLHGVYKWKQMRIVGLTVLLPFHLKWSFSIIYPLHINNRVWLEVDWFTMKGSKSSLKYCQTEVVLSFFFKFSTEKTIIFYICFKCQTIESCFLGLIFRKSIKWQREERCLNDNLYHL